jgi:hypothetical protein
MDKVLCKSARKIMNLQEVIKFTKQLSAVDKQRLIEQVAPDIEPESMNKHEARKSLWGLCADLGQAPSADDIDASRKEEWANFLPEDI